ncbi:MAG: hypothetical protein DMG23_07860 [Acidobacteria bacterium]|nr:MAG: hypothetical protein DMG23_07860 [Acidobacteriota bacterium]
MRTNPDLIRWLAAFCLAVVAGANAVFPSPPQDGVAGAPPVFSSPKKEPPPDAKKIEELSKIRVQSLLVTAPVTVLNSAGEFVYDLEENEFEVLDNGVPQRLERFEVMGRPLAVVVLVQTDDTVAPLLPHVRSLAPVFSSLVLGLQGKAAVVSYDDRVRVLQDFSNDGDRLAVTLKELVGRGGKARLNDALTRAVEMLGKRPRDERRIIVAFSDGFDSGSETVKEEVVRQATSVEVTVYGLGFNPAEELLARKPEPPPPSPLDTNVTRPLPPGTVPTPTNSQNVYGTYVPVVPILIATGEIIRSAVASSSLEYYSGYTGGVFYSHWSKKALEDQLTRIASEIHSQYELAYVPDTLNQPGFHRIEVQVRRPGVKVRARAGYFYQRSTQ